VVRPRSEPETWARRIATYTAPLIAHTAVPTWHGAHRELPFLFAASAACSASGLGLMLAPPAETAAARRLAFVAAAGDAVATTAMHRRLGPEATPLKAGRAGTHMRVATGLTAGGAALAGVLGRRSRTASVIAGAALVAGSVCTRFGIFFAGVEAADDPGYTVRPQRARLDALGTGPAANYGLTAARDRSAPASSRWKKSMNPSGSGPTFCSTMRSKPASR
jgi:hypothetical protein